MVDCCVYHPGIDPSVWVATNHWPHYDHTQMSRPLNDTSNIAMASDAHTQNVVTISHHFELILSQPHLTTRIIDALGLSKSRIKDTPASSPLGKCIDDPKSDGLFNYRSVLGMLMYLGNNTRPDCSFAIHQCARFSSDPRIPHEKAVKRIGRYLAGTKDKGLHIQKSPHFAVDCYVDASFAGDWGFIAKDDPSCAKSRTGYVITVGDNPVVWASKMQTEIALSTMEAEYIALSTAMRALIPLRQIHSALGLAFGLSWDERSNVSIVWEDNQAAKTLASNDPPTHDAAIEAHRDKIPLVPESSIPEPDRSQIHTNEFAEGRHTHKATRTPEAR